MLPNTKRKKIRTKQNLSFLLTATEFIITHTRINPRGKQRAEMYRKDLLASFNALFVQQPFPPMCWDHAQPSAAAPDLHNSLPTDVPSRELTFFSPIHHIFDFFSCTITQSVSFWGKMKPALTSPRATAQQSLPQRGMVFFSQLLVLKCCKTEQKTNPSASIWSFFPPWNA